MKKIFICILCVLLTATCCACSSKQVAETPTTEPTVETEPVTTPTETIQPTESQTSIYDNPPYNILVASKINQTPDHNGVVQITYSLTSDNKLIRAVQYDNNPSYKVTLDVSTTLITSFKEMLDTQTNDQSNDSKDNYWEITYLQDADTVISEFKGDVTNNQAKLDLISQLELYFEDIVPYKAFLNVACQFKQVDETTGEETTIKHVHIITSDGKESLTVFENGVEKSKENKQLTTEQIKEIRKYMNAGKPNVNNSESSNGDQYHFEYYKGQALDFTFFGSITDYPYLQKVIEILHN